MIKQVPCHFVKHSVHLQQCTEVAALSRYLEESRSGHHSQGVKGPKFPQKRRPVGFLTSLGKIYEKILLNKLSCRVFARGVDGQRADGFKVASGLLWRWRCQES